MIGGIGNMLVSTYSQTLKWECPGEPLKHVMTLRGQNFGKQKLTMTPLPPVCPFKTLRVYVQDVPVCTGNTRTCVSHVRVVPAYTVTF